MSYFLLGVLTLTALYLALRETRRPTPAPDYEGKHRRARRGSQAN